MATSIFNLGLAFDALLAEAKAQTGLLQTLVNQGNRLMAAIDDLLTAVTDLKTEVAGIATQMDTLLADLNAALAGNNTTAVQQAAADIQAQVTALKDAATRDMPPP